VADASDAPAVALTVPATAEHLAMLRMLAGYYAGHERFTIDQIDDLKMAVDEAGVQLLRRNAGETIRLELSSTGGGVVVRLTATVSSGPVIDRESLSWLVLRALADDLHLEEDGGIATVALTKLGLGETANGDRPSGNRVSG
jgi:serine/threonine-protein kinase RsbW